MQTSDNHIARILTENLPNLQTRLSEILEGPITQPLPNQIQLKTMYEEARFLGIFYKWAADSDLDIMEFNMHSLMVQDEDQNYITTITFTFLNILT